MKPIQTENTNAVFVLEGCMDLPATKCHDEDGQSYVESCWELSPEEIKTINETGRVYVCTMGETVAPLRISTESIVD